MRRATEEENMTIKEESRYLVDTLSQDGQRPRPTVKEFEGWELCDLEELRIDYDSRYRVIGGRLGSGEFNGNPQETRAARAAHCWFMDASRIVQAAMPYARRPSIRSNARRHVGAEIMSEAEAEATVALIESEALRIAEQLRSCTHRSDEWRARAANALEVKQANLRTARLHLEAARARSLGSPEGVSRVERERDEARTQCRALAAEIERLQASSRSSERADEDAAVNAAFVEVAGIVLAEVSFRRIMDRARDRALRSRRAAAAGPT